MNYILLLKSFGGSSMRRVAEKMEQEVTLLAKTQGGWMQLNPKENEEYVPLKSVKEVLNGHPRIINWGNHVFADDGLFSVNKPSAVSRAGNKAYSRYILQDNHIKVPTTYFSVNFLESAKFPLVVRPATHYGGRDFFVFSSLDEILPHLEGKIVGTWYASEVFDKTHEYRVHCAHGKVLLINEKPIVEGEIRANQAVTHEEWRALRWSEFNPKICVESLKTVEILQLDYGAVDIMYNSYNNSVAICEVNTSPSITADYSSGKYAQYFDWLIRHDFPPHFEIVENDTNVFYNKLLRE